MVDIVIVEDNLELGEIIKEFLLHEGYEVVWLKKGETLAPFLRHTQVNMILLDLMLGDIDGYSLCEMIRKQSAIPILMMSAKSEVADKLLGYELGADDYIEKPFPIELLLAKVKSMFRRLKQQLPQGIIQEGQLQIDQNRKMVSLKGYPVELSHKEYELLLLMINYKGKPLRKEFLFQSIWGVSSDSMMSTLTVHINTLREKLEEDPRSPKRIKTIWGIGYQYETI